MARKRPPDNGKPPKTETGAIGSKTNKNTNQQQSQKLNKSR